jgi:hypothetical protein
LLEVAIVLIVIGLVLAVGSSVLPWINESKSLARTRQVMDQASLAALTFSLTNNRLPCPADPALGAGDAGFGIEDCSRSTGIVPHEALLLSAPVVDVASRPILYAVYRDSGSQADLAAVTPLVDGLDEPVPVLNVHDFCRALKNGNPAAGTGLASISSTTTGGCLPGTFVNQAYVLSSAGIADADGDGNPFDGNNADGTPACFASPQQTRSALYDDLVSAVSFSAILGQVCG